MKHAVLQQSAPSVNFPEAAEPLVYKLRFKFAGKSVLLATSSAVAQARLRTAYGNFLSPMDREPDVTVLLAPVGSLPVPKRYLGYRETDWAVVCDSHPAILYESDEGRATFASIGIMHHLLISSLAEDAVVLHAATLTFNDRLVLIPGRAGIGKSTIAASLVGAGFKLMSDELAPIDPETLTIRPCPLPIGLRNSGVSVGDEFGHHVVGSIRHKIGDEDRTINELSPDVIEHRSLAPSLLVLPDPNDPSINAGSDDIFSSAVPRLLRASYCDPMELRTFDTCVKLSGLPTVHVTRAAPAVNAKAIIAGLQQLDLSLNEIPS